MHVLYEEDGDMEWISLLLGLELTSTSYTKRESSSGFGPRRRSEGRHIRRERRQARRHAPARSTAASTYRSKAGV